MSVSEHIIPLSPGRPRSGNGNLREDGSRHPAAGKGASYYDVPMLKPSLWSWEISSYFFLGGVAGGSFLIARAANRFGGGQTEIARTGTAIALAALAPCAPLLIADLGDPRRFHYMLRVFKPNSPMNLGAWVLTAFGGVLSLAAVNEWRKSRRHGTPGALEQAADSIVGAVSDLVGVPLAATLAGYTGVLLSTTATPVWTRNPWIGPLFSASAISTGSSAISLAGAMGRRKSSRRVERPLRKLSAAARIAEVVALGGFLSNAGGLAKPLVEGAYSPHLWGGAVGAGLVLSTVLESLPAPSPKARKWLRAAGAVAGLVGGLALRWAITQAGKPSGSDSDAARRSSRRRG